MNSYRLFASCVVAGMLGMMATSTAPAAMLHGGDILVADPGLAGGSGTIFLVNPVTGAQSTLSTGNHLIDPQGIALDANGMIVVADPDFRSSSAGAIYRINPADGSQTLVSGGGSFKDPTGLAIESSGQILVTDIGANALFRIDPITGVQSTVATGGSGKFGQPIGLAVESDGNILIGDLNGKLWRVDPGSGAQTLLASGFTEADAVAVESSGDILLADRWGPAVYRLDSDGSSSAALSSGGNFSISAGPQGLALQADGGILAVDAYKKLVRIDPTTGAQSLLSSGGDFASPAGVAVVVPEPSTLALITLGGSTLLMRQRRAILGRHAPPRRRFTGGHAALSLP